MKTIRNKLFHLVIALLLSTIVGCRLYSVSNFDYDRSTDFRQYKTYAWLPDNDNSNNELNNQIIRNNIKNYFSHEFVDNYGFTPNVDTPDVLIEFQVNVSTKQQTESHAVQQAVPNNPYNTPYRSNPYSNNPYYTPTPNPYNYNNSSGYHYTTTYVTHKHPYTESSITLNIIDRKTNQLIWTATADGDIYADESYNIGNELHPAVHRILDYYPIKPKKNKQ